MASMPMEKNTAQMTFEFMRNNPDIKRCLKKGLINYSALSRHIAKELSIGNKSSKEAILIAARRYRAGLAKESAQDERIQDLLSRSQIEMRNRIAVHTLDKGIVLDHIDELQRLCRKESNTFYFIESSDFNTLITSDRYTQYIQKRFRTNILKRLDSQTLINLRTGKEIERTLGVIAYLTSLFAENGVNITEFFSCHTDTVFIIANKDVTKAMEFLRF
jgi:hypothetical protein